MTGARRPRLLFIGFHGAIDGSSPESQNELVAALLQEHGYDVRSGSRKVRQVPRLIDQLMLLIRNVRWADAAVIDVFSGRRALTPFLLVRIARAAKVPAVLVLHGGGLPDYVRDHAWQIDSTLRLATTVVAPSPYLQRAFAARGFAVIEVPNLVELPISEPDRSRRMAAGRVLWMRAFDTEYRPLLAVEAFALLVEKHPDARLTMAGPDRGLLDQARRSTVALGISDRVDFPGYLGVAEKAAAMREHGVFLNTTSVDNTPVSVLEAMASGLPVVATDVGGMADLLQGGQAGLLVADNDADALASALAHVLEDEDLCQRLVGAGHDVASRFAPDSVVSGWRSVLERIGVQATSNPGTRIGPLALSDLEQIAVIHCDAFPDSVTTQLGPRVVRQYYRWQFIGPHPDPVGIGVWSDGVLVGFLFGGARRGAVSGFVRSSVGTIALGALTHPAALRRLALPKVVAVARAMFGRSGPVRPQSSETDPASTSAKRPMANPSFGVLSVAVSPSARGSGAATELMQRAESWAIASDYRGMHLTVDAGNVRAIAFYRKLGWHDAGASDEASRLMIKPLGSA